MALLPVQLSSVASMVLVMKIGQYWRFLSSPHDCLKVMRSRVASTMSCSSNGCGNALY